MSAVKYLLDEHVAKFLGSAINRLDPTVKVVCIGANGAPESGTLDPALLEWSEANSYGIVTMDRNTMPGYAAEFLAAGHHTWGIFILRPRSTLRDIVDSLVLIHSGSQAEEWRDRVEFVP